jgi:VWFA-related protein
MKFLFPPSASRRISFMPLSAAVCLAIVNALFLPLPSSSQDTPAQQAPATTTPATPSGDKITSNQPGPSAKTLKVSVTLVTVPVVVRDSTGHAVGNLQKENFQLFDNHKPAEINYFFVEKTERPDSSSPSAFGAEKFRQFVAPNRFTALLFDDLHANFSNLSQLQAASKHLITSVLARTERLGIFTTSGKLSVDFTDNRDRLQDAIRRLKPSPLPGSRPPSCPSLSHYEANQIIRRHDGGAREAAIGEVMGQCGVKDPRMAEQMVNESAEQVLSIGDLQTVTMLKSLSTLVDRLSALPGHRTLVLASPSFFVGDSEHRESLVIDRAIRSHVIISTMDTRGVYTDSDENIDADVLAELADGTGGTFVRNSNDLTAGLSRVVSAPEFVYQLAFSPKDLKEDGKYHHLQVKVTGSNNLVVAAREGYFAPNRFSDPAQVEKLEINSAVFSQNEIHDLPIRMHTQFIQDDKPMAKLSVSALVDVRDLPHRESNGQNANELRLIAAVFDHNGRYLGAIQRKVAVHWSEAATQEQTATTFSFLLDSGGYLVRLVVRDSESQHLYAADALVEIPNKVPTH